MDFREPSSKELDNIKRLEKQPCIQVSAIAETLFHDFQMAINVLFPQYIGQCEVEQQDFIIWAKRVKSFGVVVDANPEIRYTDPKPIFDIRQWLLSQGWDIISHNVFAKSLSTEVHIRLSESKGIRAATFSGSRVIFDWQPMPTTELEATQFF